MAAMCVQAIWTASALASAPPELVGRIDPDAIALHRYPASETI